VSATEEDATPVLIPADPLPFRTDEPDTPIWNDTFYDLVERCPMTLADLHDPEVPW
jgi:hypothetical protein